MEAPSESLRKYYVYGFWHIDEGKPIVTKNNKNYIRSFDNIDDATKYLKRQSLANVNITWCLTWDSYEADKIMNF